MGLFKSKMNFKDEESLQSVRMILDDSNLALNDRSRTINDSPLKTALLAVGSGTSFAASVGLIIGASGIVGAGLIPVVGPIVAVTAATTALILKKKKAKELSQTKSILYRDAIAKQNAIIRALKEESAADKERIEYLDRLNEALKKAIVELKQDLGY